MFCVVAFLDELEQLLKGIAMMKEMTLRTKDYLVSFGECMSTRVFAAYLNKIGAKARQVSSTVNSRSLVLYTILAFKLRLPCSTNIIKWALYFATVQARSKISGPCVL